MARILIVDDDADVTGTVEAMLFGTGHEVTCENKSVHVAGILSREIFDLIISDVFMPDCDGVELVLRIKKASPKTKILIITGGGQLFPSGSEALGTIIGNTEIFGANAVLMKPFKRQQLIDAVAELVGQTEAKSG